VVFNVKTMVIECVSIDTEGIRWRRQPRTWWDCQYDEFWTVPWGSL